MPGREDEGKGVQGTVPDAAGVPDMPAAGSGSKRAASPCFQGRRGRADRGQPGAAQFPVSCVSCQREGEGQARARAISLTAAWAFCARAAGEQGRLADQGLRMEIARDGLEHAEKLLAILRYMQEDAPGGRRHGEQGKQGEHSIGRDRDCGEHGELGGHGGMACQNAPCEGHGQENRCQVSGRALQAV